MRYRYLDEEDVLYVEVKTGTSSRQELIDNGTVVDLDENGQLLGIEIVSPQSDWPAEEVIDRFRLQTEEAEYLRELARQAFAFSHARMTSSSSLTVIQPIG